MIEWSTEEEILQEYISGHSCIWYFLSFLHYSEIAFCTFQKKPLHLNSSSHKITWNLLSRQQKDDLGNYGKENRRI